MRFVLHASALEGDDSAFDKVDRLVDRLADEIHRVEMPEADLLQESRWYQSARLTLRNVLMTAVAGPPRKPPERGPHVKVVEVLDPESALVAAKLAHAPLVILVEDRESDGVFLDILVEELGWDELQSLWANGKRVTPRAIEVETAGGKGSIPQRIQRAVSDAAEENRPCRLFVLCDGDARWPGDEKPLKELDLVRTGCHMHGVPLHILQKRYAENYIPDRVFEDMRDDPRNQNLQNQFNALLRRSQLQRDHFPVKDGLDGSERAGALQATLYDPSEEADLKLLETRLFPKRPRPFSLLYRERRGSLTAEGIRARDNAGELDTLLRSIAQEL